MRHGSAWKLLAKAKVALSITGNLAPPPPKRILGG